MPQPRPRTRLAVVPQPALTSAARALQPGLRLGATTDTVVLFNAGAIDLSLWGRRARVSIRRRFGLLRASPSRACVSRSPNVLILLRPSVLILLRVRISARHGPRARPTVGCASVPSAPRTRTCQCPTARMRVQAATHHLPHFRPRVAQRIVRRLSFEQVFTHLERY